MIDATATFLASCLVPAPERDSVASVRDWFAARTHPGLVRTENQDRVAIASWHRDQNVWWASVLADGIGSGRAGAEAATLTVAAFLGSLIGGKAEPLPAALARAGEDANQALHRKWRGNEGSTLSAIVARGRDIALVNIGDSRAYGIDVSGAIRLLTKDDVLPAHGSLLQFVGMGRDLVPHATTLPDDLTRALLTSDGAHGYLAPILQQIVLTAAHDHRALVDRVVHISNWCGGGDNTSCVSLTLRPPPNNLPAVGPWVDLWTPGSRNRFAFASVAPATSVRSARPQHRERNDAFPTVRPQAASLQVQPASVPMQPAPDAPPPAALPGSSPSLSPDAPGVAPHDPRGVTMTYEDVPVPPPVRVSEPPAQLTYRANPKGKKSARGTPKRSNQPAAAPDGSSGVAEPSARAAKKRGGS